MTTYGIIGTYPPTTSALATFTDRLRTGLLADHADEVRIVRAGALPHAGEPAEVVAWFVNGRTDTGPAVTALNECDIAMIQHDFGLYGGADGQDVLGVADRLRVPAIAILHTVPESPSPHEREVLEELTDRVDAIAVTSDPASDRLLADYAVDAAKIAVIPYGSQAPRPDRPETSYAGGNDGDGDGDGDGSRQAVILTWGPLGPGRGIEWGVEALAAVRAAGIDARYVIAGQTHPAVRKASGESYRESLQAKARELGVQDAVEFDDAFRSTDDLIDLISTADVVLLPQESAEQVTSGVLIRTLASGRPVVASTSPHAEELLATGAGITVPRRDPQAIASAVERILTEPGTAASMASQARSLATGSDWAAVAAGYGRLASLLRADRGPLLV